MSSRKKKLKQPKPRFGLGRNGAANAYSSLIQDRVTCPQS